MEMIDMSDIGPLIRQLRYKCGWTQKQLADKLWVDILTVDKWERGADMSFADVVSVFRVLGARIIIKLPEEVKTCDNCSLRDICAWRHNETEIDGECKYWTEE